ncbi:MAG: hypothetical protein ABI616_07985 [Pseudomonadota bacterium]
MLELGSSVQSTTSAPHHVYKAGFDQKADMVPRVLRVAAVAMSLALPAFAEETLSTGAVVLPAVDGVFEAFRTHPLVGLGDDHGLASGMDLCATLIRDPRFAREVGNVVVEFGTAQHQDVLDRYLNGERLPYVHLRSIWTDTVGWIPPAGYLGFARFLAAVRSVNKSLKSQQRIRVWLGEPPIDWKAPTRDELMKAMSVRDSYPAGLIEQQILAQQRKALVIYGFEHLTGGPMLRGKIETTHPGAFFTVIPYGGAHRPAACMPLLDQAAKILPTPVFAIPAPGGASDTLRECLTRGRQVFDAVLLYGPPDTLTRGAYMPDYVLDTDLRLEMQRRAQLGGMPLIRFPANLSLRRADYDVDLDAPGFSDLMDAMFARNDKDGVITAAEYQDPIPK